MSYLKGNWRDIFNNLRIALDVRKMFLGFASLATIGIGIILFFIIISTQVVNDYNETVKIELSENPNKSVIDVDNLGFADRNIFEIISDKDGYAFTNVIKLTLEDIGIKQYKIRTEIANAQELLEKPEDTNIEIKTRDVEVPMFPGYQARGFDGVRVIILIIISLLVLWIVSRWLGAISRISIVEIAKDERIEMREAMDFAKRNGKPLFWAPISLVVFFFVLYFSVVLWGVVGSIPVAGPILTILTSPLVLIAGFLMAILVFGGIFSINLYEPAICAEATDSFDSLSRAYSYFFSKPFHFIGYSLVSIVFGAICIGFVWLMTYLVLYFVSSAGSLGMGSTFDMFYSFITQTPYKGEDVTIYFIYENAGFFPTMFAFVIGILVVIIVGMSFSYIVSYYYTATAMMYLLLRKKVDGTDMTEIFYEEVDFIKAIEDSIKTDENQKSADPKEESTKDEIKKPATDEKPEEPESDKKADEDKTPDADVKKAADPENQPDETTEKPKD